MSSPRSQNLRSRSCSSGILTQSGSRHRPRSRETFRTRVGIGKEESIARVAGIEALALSPRERLNGGPVLTRLFDYELPEALFARYPSAERDGGRLLVLGPTGVE